ncbi:MAG: MFS transporter [Acidimicrobiales bacterium]
MPSDEAEWVARNRGSKPLRDVAHAVGRSARAGASAVGSRLTVALGGPTRAQIILVLAGVLALSSADAATVGASAIELRAHLHINNTDIGLLVAVSSLVGAIAAVPFGVLADRVRRTWTLSTTVVLWGVAMLWSALARSFGELLLTRLALGVVTAAAGPIVASLVGDYFPGRERGRIYSFILTGELVGAGVGFAITGDIAALSWRAAFVILAIPAFFLAYLVFRLPEPARGGQGALFAEPQYRPLVADAPEPEVETDRVTDAQRLALERNIAPDPRLVREGTVGRMGFMAAASYVLHVRTNVALIVSGACAYYFLAGVQTFGVEFVHAQYHVNQVLANGLMLVVGVGAAAGVLVSGPLSDRLLAHGHLKARIQVGAYAAVITVALFIPALATHSSFTALPYMIFAGAALSAQNPPIDAARLDIMPAFLWGRAEGIRTFVRTGAQALAPLLFGALSDLLSGSHPYSGLRWTFVIMLLPLGASVVFLFRAMRTYPTDVVTAAVVTKATGSRGLQRGAEGQHGQAGPAGFEP